MIDIADREPHDEKTPEQTIAHVIQEWEDEWQPNARMRPLAELIIEALTYKAYFEGAEGALQWLDPATESPTVMERIGLN